MCNVKFNSLNNNIGMVKKMLVDHNSKLDEK